MDQGSLAGNMPALLTDLSTSLAAFYHDLGDTMKRVTVVAMSEFGRRASENGGQGTDHGRGNVMLTMGKSLETVEKSMVNGPGLSPEAASAR